MDKNQCLFVFDRSDMRPLRRKTHSTIGQSRNPIESRNGPIGFDPQNQAPEKLEATSRDQVMQLIQFLDALR